VEDLGVDLDEKRGTLDVLVRQDDTEYPSRIVSEGTLRVLALCAIAADPWSRGLIAFEEPENGVHPRRLELIARLLVSLAMDRGRQVIVTTHSALFCDAILKETRAYHDEVALLNVRRGDRGTEVSRFNNDPTSLFQDREFTAALAAPGEDGLFEGLLLRGLLDG
jgi:predicted ATPase